MVRLKSNNFYGDLQEIRIMIDLSITQFDAKLNFIVIVFLTLKP